MNDNIESELDIIESIVYGIVMAGFVAVTATALCSCTNTSHDFSLAGSVEGVRAYNDGVIGLAKTMVEPKTRSLYMNTRKQQEAETTTRQVNPTFLQRLADAMKGGSNEKK